METPCQKELSRLYQELSILDPTSSEYATIATHLYTLDGMDRERSKLRHDTVKTAIVSGLQAFGLVFIVKAERWYPIASKAFSLLKLGVR